MWSLLVEEMIGEWWPLYGIVLTLLGKAAAKSMIYKISLPVSSLVAIDYTVLCQRGVKESLMVQGNVDDGSNGSNEGKDLFHRFIVVCLQMQG
jgi:hypothetical protein